MLQPVSTNMFLFWLLWFCNPHYLFRKNTKRFLHKTGMSRRFEGKSVLITGATSGIGKATAIAFAKEGAKVAFTGRREAEGNAVRDEIIALGIAPENVIFIQSDVSKLAQVENMVAKTVQAFGRLDVAFNNAGVGTKMVPLPDQTEEDYDFVMDINLKGLWASMKYEIREMLKTGGGSIVNMASIAGVVGFANFEIYTASKFGVVGLTKSSALSYAKQNIRVNAVNPGTIATDMIERAKKDMPQIEDILVALHPIGRVGTSDEVANAVLFLASDQASFITGQCLNIDGGYTTQ